MNQIIPTPLILKKIEPLYQCLVCGLRYEFLPWGENMKSPSFDICDCCGVEFGYGDSNISAIINFRKLWVDGGYKWRSPEVKPSEWDAQKQLSSLPSELSDENLIKLLENKNI